MQEKTSTGMSATLREEHLTFMKDLGSVNPWNGQPMTAGYPGFTEIGLLFNLVGVKYEIKENGEVEFTLPSNKLVAQITNYQMKIER